MVTHKNTNSAYCMISRYIAKISSPSHKIGMIQKPVCYKNYIYIVTFFPEIDNFERCVKGRNKIPLTFLIKKIFLHNVEYFLQHSYPKVIFNTSSQSFHLRLDNSSQMSGSVYNCEFNDT